MELSTDRILATVVSLARTQVGGRPARALDVGSGTGALIALLKSESPALETSACDYTDRLMKVAGQKVDLADLNSDALPYPDGTFDLVTCSEVIEHLENYRRIVREVHRVLKPGGVAIFSTPNVLSLQSRLRFLGFGFWNLFGPLPVGRAESFSTVGHITPVSWFYLAHALAEAGFGIERLAFDKMQRSAVPKLLLWWPFIAVAGWLARRRERRKYRTIDAGNAHIVAAMNGARMLLGRTIIVMARKPGAGAAAPAANA